MSDSPLFWLALTLFFMIFEAFFASMEMSLVSFNKIRLQYYVSKGKKRAIWINSLLHSPSRLFGTTLLLVSLALQMGSECSREFYSSLGLDPSLAPLTQIPLILIFAELAPMFAARRYSEQVAMLGIRVLYAASKLMAPFTWAIGHLSRFANRLIGAPAEGTHIFLSREELQHTVEEQEEGISLSLEDKDLNLIVSNIFSFRSKVAKEAMLPLHTIPMLPSNATVGAMRTELIDNTSPFLALFYRIRPNIVSIALPRNLVKIEDDKRISDHARTPWFVLQNTPLIEILHQFRTNNENVAVVLDTNGLAVGVLTLDDTLDEIFGERPHTRIGKRTRFLERSFRGDMQISEFNRTFDASLSREGAETLGELMTHHLGHHPENGESLRIGELEFTALETTLLDVKTVGVKTLL
jgi:putative hemolysin